MGFFKKKEKEEEGAVKAKGGNPYLDGREEWLERYGSYISRAAQWRMATLLVLCICIISISGNVAQMLQVKTIPYIIEVDKTGQAMAVGRADKASVTPQRLIQAEVANCIIQWRTVTADVELQKGMLARLAYFFTGHAKGVLRTWYDENNPFEIAKTGKLIHIEIKSLPLPVSSDSYRVEWVETTRSHAGAILDKQTYEATATVQINPPVSDTVLLHNPGGVYITQLAVSKVLSTPQQTKKTQN